MTTKNMNTPPGSTQENEIDLLRLVGELWDHRKFIISVTALFTLIAVAYSLYVGFAWIVVLLIGWMFKRRHDRQLAENQ